MLSLPAFVFALIGSDTKCEALFAEQHVPAVTGVYGNDGVVFRELANPSLFSVNVAFAVKAAHPVVGVAEHFQNFLADTRHNAHIEHDVNRVGKLNTGFCKRRTDRAHGIGNDIHGSALVAVAGNIVNHFIGFFGVHPVVGGAGILFLFGADEGSVLHAGHVVDRGSVIIAIGEQFLVEFDQFAGGAGFFAKRFNLLFRAVNPDDFVGLHKLDFFVDP